MRIALVSEHASPLAVLGGVDAGGQNVHVAALATALAARGDEVVVHTRRGDAALPRPPRRPRAHRAARDEQVTDGPLRVLPLGGLGEIGKNMTVVELDGRILVVDTGLRFPTAEMLGIDLVLPDFT